MDGPAPTVEHRKARGEGAAGSPSGALGRAPPPEARARPALLMGRARAPLPPPATAGRTGCRRSPPAGGSRGRAAAGCLEHPAHFVQEPRSDLTRERRGPDGRGGRHGAASAQRLEAAATERADGPGASGTGHRTRRDGALESSERGRIVRVLRRWPAPEGAGPRGRVARRLRSGSGIEGGGVDLARVAVGGLWAGWAGVGLRQWWHDRFAAGGVVLVERAGPVEQPGAGLA